MLWIFHWMASPRIQYSVETRRARSMQHAAEVEVVALQHVEVVDVLVVLAGGEVGASQRRR